MANDEEVLGQRAVRLSFESVGRSPMSRVISASTERRCASGLRAEADATPRASRVLLRDALEDLDRLR